MIYKIFVILQFFALCFFSAIRAYGETDEFRTLARDLEKSFGGRMGIMAMNLRTGEVLAYKASEKFPTASLIKVPVMVEYFYQVAEGKVRPEQMITLADSNKWGGSGLFQFFRGTTQQQLADAVMMMITISDNTATNMVIDALGQTHREKLRAVNERMRSLGLKNTRLLNKLMSWATKTDSPESIRYGVGVSTPEDMVLLFEKMYRKELVDSLACEQMIDILRRQFYNSMIPALLPFESTDNLYVAHKTGSVTGVRTDAGLIFSPQADIAIAIFCDQVQDRRGNAENLAMVAGAKMTRWLWNYFTGDSGMDRPYVTSIDWNAFPGGEWTRFFVHNAPFPHPSRRDGYRYKDKFFPFDPHYTDSSVVVIIPEGYRQSDDGVDMIVHFHGWNNDNLNVLEQFDLVQQLIAARKNAILVLAQGPWRASDSAGGKMEDRGGFGRFVREIAARLQQDGKLKSDRINAIIISAHSGGYRPAIYAVAVGEIQKHIREVYLFDAFYALTEKLLPWLKQSDRHRLRSIYTQHLGDEHKKFKQLLQQNGLGFSETFSPQARIVLEPTDVCHNCVIEGTFQKWLQDSVLEDLAESK